MTDVVLTEVDAAVAVVTLNRPERRNAVNAELLSGLRATLAALDADPEVAAIVLTGAGSAFCAGMDLADLDALVSVPGLIAWDATLRTSAPWEPLETPVVGAVNGAAVTGGLEIALACDVLVGSDRASFADTHARAGLVPGWGLTVRLPLAVGLRAARAMSLTGDYVDAATALRLGLVYAAVPHADLLPTALTLAQHIADNDRAAVHSYVRLYRAVEAELVDDAYQREAEHSRAHLERTYRPGAIGDRKDDIIARGRSQRCDPRP
ncbi:MAG: short chain enoyl-CoA hydratase [Nocardioides sp.]|nr:short chain enoyl-CoA hydratase [Nocardioides sp.]